MKHKVIKLIILVGIIVGSAGIISIVLEKEDSVVPLESDPVQSVAMCYRYGAQTDRGFFDQAWLKMNIKGDQVAGEYQNLPAEKDSKIGIFSGTVGAMDPMISARTALVWWDSLAEGVTVTEQLHIVFGEGSASAMFGEMIDRGDGVYIYRDSTKLTSGFQMGQIDCELLDSVAFVETYIRTNIAMIAPEQAVLGGTWYVTSIFVNPSTKTGFVSYEDGHIMGNADFSYVMNGDQVVITSITKK